MVSENASQSNSSDYFGQDDPDFLEALQSVVLPGDIVAKAKDLDDSDIEELPAPAQPPRKRSFSATLEDNQEKSRNHEVMTSDDDIYGPSRFGGWGEYMRRKRAKLQIQNAELEENSESSASQPKIFKGLSIYINGWTQPSVQELRQLILKHGGIFRPYLDKKSLVTHIITCSLTPAKMQEFKYMKVVRPEWLTESAEAGVLLSWTDYIFKPQDRPLAGQIATSTQRTLPLQSIKSSSNTTGEGSVVDLGFRGPALETKIRGQTMLLAVDNKDAQLKAPAAPTSGAKTIVTDAPPQYAAESSNPLAKRVMANPDWRKAHTSVAPDFIDGYYKHSRLHHLSIWKAELKNLVHEALERAEAGTHERSGNDGKSIGKISSEVHGVSMRGAELNMRSPSKAKGKEKAVDDRVIMHCDFDCFFVSAGLVSRPHLKGKPVVVCHSQGAQGGALSTSEIASASYEARSFGIKNGMSLQQARKLCPDIQTIPYEFERYKEFSLKFYTVLMTHADDVQAVSVDEALIELTNTVAQLRAHISDDSSNVDPAKDFAETLRAQIRAATGCEVSIGISHNILLARLATRRAKPAGSYHLLPADVSEFLAPLDISDLHGFGWSAKQKAREKLGATILGELTKKGRAQLCDALGKATGETLYNALRGIDDKKLESDTPRRSVSCEINYGIRFENNEQAEAFVYQMAAEVSKRLLDIDMAGRSVTMKIMKRDPTAPVEPPKFLGHGACDLFNRQAPLIGPAGKAVNDERIIGQHAWRLLKSFNFDPRELRGIGIQVQKLESPSARGAPEQATLHFKQPTSPRKPLLTLANHTSATPYIHVQPPSEGNVLNVDDGKALGHSPQKLNATTDLPSFSQVDQSVFHALPPDIKKELEDEYQRRSRSRSVSVGPSKLASPMKLASRTAVARPGIFPRKVAVKGPNYRRIAQQLAPRSKAAISPANNWWLMGRKKKQSARTSDAALRKLGIDPEVFAALPRAVKDEQLIRARLLKERGSLPDSPTQRKVIKPRKPPPIPAHLLYRAPPPRARHVPPPTLRQQGEKKGEKIKFSEKEDILGLIDKWMKAYHKWTPQEKDLEFFSKYLLKCVDSSQSTDAGVEQAVAVMKWWLVLLRRYHGGSEFVEDEEYEDPNSQKDIVGEAWWKAFRDIKEQMDVIARKKFGGRLSLK